MSAATSSLRRAGPKPGYLAIQLRRSSRMPGPAMLRRRLDEYRRHGLCLERRPPVGRSTDLG